MNNQDPQPQGKNAPVERFNDGGVNAKIWRNVSKDGKPFYNVTFARTYTNPETGLAAETKTFSGTDVLKIQRLAAQAYHAVDRLKKQDRIHSNEQVLNQAQDQGQTQGHAQNLADQRNAVMDNAVPQQGGQDAAQSRSGPEMER